MEGALVNLASRLDARVQPLHGHRVESPSDRRLVLLTFGVWHHEVGVLVPAQPLRVLGSQQVAQHVDG